MNYNFKKMKKRKGKKLMKFQYLRYSVFTIGPKSPGLVTPVAKQ